MIEADTSPVSAFVTNLRVDVVCPGLGDLGSVLEVTGGRLPNWRWKGE